jgi:hypothetical protein
MSKLRVAVYCRVSSDSDEQGGNSLEVQMGYYRKLILSHEEGALVDSEQ